MHPIDQALQSSAPTVVVPRYGNFEPLAENGHRILMTGQGVWLEVRRPWLYARRPLTPTLPIAVPYGSVTPTIDLNFGSLPASMLFRFQSEARRACPNEHGAWIVWNHVTKAFRYVELDVAFASENRLRVERPGLEDDESLILDLHSHGTDEAYFSPIDDRDDRGEVVLSAVLGNCHDDKPSFVLRLCLLGLFIPLNVSSPF